MGPSTMINLQVSRSWQESGEGDPPRDWTNPCCVWVQNSVLILALASVCGARREPRSFAGAIRHRGY